MKKDFIDEFFEWFIFSSWMVVLIIYTTLFYVNNDFISTRERFMIFMILFIPLFVFSNFFGGRR